MKRVLVIALTLIAVLLSSCSTIKTEFVRSKLGVSKEEVKQLQQTMDPDTKLSEASALALYVMNKYMNSDGTFKGQPESVLKEDRVAISVELTHCTLWIAYPKSGMKIVQSPYQFCFTPMVERTIVGVISHISLLWANLQIG